MRYTSGTTADPKGIILTHGNYVTNIYQAYSLMDIPSFYKTLLILPWDHSFGHTCGIYAFMGKGASIASAKDREDTDGSSAGTCHHASRR
ncbi:MAG: AMP-binding protein [Ignavibacteriales bacterium]|nr:AMP-binding protein [Ignavibacteriales bacterium]